LENTSVPLRICNVLTRWAKGDPKKLVIAIMFACGLTSGIMSNLSTCIIYLNLGLALLKANNCEPRNSNLGKSLMIGIPCAAGVGGLITPAGTPGNLLIIQLLETQGITMSFLQWVLFFAPLALLCILIGSLWIVHLYKPEDISSEAIHTLQDNLEKNRFSENSREKDYTDHCCYAYLLASWHLVSVLNVTVVAVVGMAVLFFPGIAVLDWKATAARINWDLCLTIGSVGVLIGGMTSTGIMDWIVARLFSGIAGWSLIPMFFVLGLVICIIRAFIPTAPAIVALFGAPLLSLVARKWRQTSRCSSGPASFLGLRAYVAMD
jgi:sodium-dependent dicarboxylate transporter 2/3/5